MCPGLGFICHSLLQELTLLVLKKGPLAKKEWRKILDFYTRQKLHVFLLVDALINSIFCKYHSTEHLYQNCIFVNMVMHN